MSKRLITLIVMAGTGLLSLVIIFMIYSADKANKKSHKILEEFKIVDGNLKRSNRVTDSFNKGTGAFDSVLQK